MVLGCHFSITDLLLIKKSIEDHNLSCGQIMITNGRQYRVSKEFFDNHKFFSNYQSKGFNFILHMPYTINLSDLTIEDDAFISSRNYYGIKKCFEEHIRFCRLTGIKYIVLHGGSIKVERNKESSVKGCETFLRRLNRVAGEALSSVIEVGYDFSVEDVPTFLVENTSGGGTSLGDVNLWLNSLQNINSELLPKKLGVCLDTAHAWANGYPAFEMEFYKTLNPAWKTYLKVIHFNVPDEKVVYGKHLDRHNSLFFDREIITKEFIKEFFNSEYKNIPCVVENDLTVALDNVKYIKEILV